MTAKQMQHPGHAQAATSRRFPFCLLGSWPPRWCRFLHLSRSVQQIRAFQEVTAAIRSSLELKQTLEQAMDSAMSVFGADRAAIFLVEPGGERISCAASRKLSERYLRDVEGYYDRQPPPLPTETNPAMSLYFEDASVNPPAAGLREPIRREGIRSILMLRLHIGETTIGTFVLYHNRVRRYRQSEIALGQTFADQAAIAIENARLHEESKRLAVSEERNRLARELHDSVAQSLSSIALISQALPRILQKDADYARERIERVTELARDAQAEMRAIILQLRPISLQEEGLARALAKLTETFQAREQIEVQLRVEGDRRLPLSIEEAMWRIAQEALNNVAKHAGASKVWVELRVEPALAALTVADDGSGFQIEGAPAERTTLGITSMRERAALLGGAIAITSLPDKGTTVDLQIPLHAWVESANDRPD
jgi:signal transduction histidine kinase